MQLKEKNVQFKEYICLTYKKCDILRLDVNICRVKFKYKVY